MAVSVRQVGQVYHLPSAVDEHCRGVARAGRVREDSRARAAVGLRTLSAFRERDIQSHAFELENRNHELTELNNDLINLVTGIDLPIVMLSEDPRIRRFTPMAAKLLNFIEADIGRPISDIRPYRHREQFLRGAPELLVRALHLLGRGLDLLVGRLQLLDCVGVVVDEILRLVLRYLELPDELLDPAILRSRSVDPVWTQKNSGPWTAYGGGYQLVHLTGFRSFPFAGWLLQRDVGRKWTLGGEVRYHGPEGFVTPARRFSTMIDLGGHYYFINPGEQLLFCVGHTALGQPETYAHLGLYWTWGSHGGKG